MDNELPLKKDSEFMSTPAAAGVARALFDQSPFSTVIYDAEGHPLAVNDAFKAMNLLPSNVKSTVSTAPAGVLGLSAGDREILSM